MDIKILKDLFLTIERCNPLKCQDQTVYKRIMVYPGLLKSGKVEMENTIDQGNLIEILGIHCEKLTLFVKNIFSAGLRILQGTKRLFTIERGNPFQRISKERLILKISSWEVRQQNLSIKSETKCELDRKECQALQRIVPNISIIWGMFMATTLNAATFMGKNFSTMQNVVQNEEKITLKQMFDVTAQMVHNEEEISGLDKILYQKNSWTQLSLINDPVIINLQSKKVYVFSDSVLCLGKVLQHPECNEAWKNRLAGVRAERSYRDYEDVSGGSTEFEWNIFPGFTSLQLCDKISNLLSSLGQSPETFTGRILFMSMFNDVSCDRYDNKDECLKNAEFVKTFAKKIWYWTMVIHWTRF